MDKTDIRLTFPGMFAETLTKFGKHNAYAFVGEEPKSYETVNKEIRALMAFEEKIGICPGDKVAILSLNMPNWGVAYFSLTFMGAVVVPILPDFSGIEVANILEHSGAKALFISNSLLSRIEGFKSEDLKMTILIEKFSVINAQEGSVTFDPPAIPVKNYKVEEEDLFFNLIIFNRNC